MSFTVRRLTAEDDAEAAWQLGFEAFGVPSPRPGPATFDLPGRTWFGAFVDDLLVGRMIDRAYASYFGRALVPTCGIAAVTVAADWTPPTVCAGTPRGTGVRTTVSMR